ncbi:hypothetical protein MKW92_051887 [Papaver armeniacum]|nr:hypothetical protein MKW92_051887 [Papaver armeniacum]
MKFSYYLLLLLVILGSVLKSESIHQPFRRDPGKPPWRHGEFHHIKDNVRSDVRKMLHTRAVVPFQVPLEVNVILVGFRGDGGFRYSLDIHKLEAFLKLSFPTHRPACLETGELIGIEHRLSYNVFPAGQQELIALERAMKKAMVPAGTARENEFGREVPLFEVDAKVVDPVFERLYSYTFDMNGRGGKSTEDMIRSVPSAIIVVNFDKVRMDPRNELDLRSLMYETIPGLTEDEMKKQDTEYIYRYRYNGGGASQVWLGSGRFVVVDLSAGPCTYGKIDYEEGCVSSRTLPRLYNLIFPKGSMAASVPSTHNIFMGQLGALISTTIQHVIAPDIRFETVDLARRLLVPIIVLRNHNLYNVMDEGHNYSIDVQAIEAEVKKMVSAGQEVVVIGGSHSLHQHEKLAIAVYKAMRGQSLQASKPDGSFHVHTKTYLDGSLLKEEMERSGDMLAAGLLEVSDSSLLNKFFLHQIRMENSDGPSDSFIKHRSIQETDKRKHGNMKRKDKQKKLGSLYRTYGTRVIPVFVLSLANIDENFLMEDESLVWTSKDVVIVLQHQTEKIPLSYVSETERRYAFPLQAQRHIIAGLASAVGGLSAPYEKVSQIHERPMLNWLWAAGCHPFGPFSNTSEVSQMLQDVALRSNVYSRVDAALNRVRDTSETVQSFAAEYLKTPFGKPVKGKKNKTSTELWVEKLYKKTTHLPEPFPHELVERLEKYLDSLEEQLVDLSSLLYDHRLKEADLNSTDILEKSMRTQKYVDHILVVEREKMRCCEVQYEYPESSQALICAVGIVIAGLCVYFVILFSYNHVS